MTNREKQSEEGLGACTTGRGEKRWKQQERNEE